MALITPGVKAPDFTLESDNGEKLKLSSLKGKNVVLFFYPKADTPGCTTEACEFRDEQSALRLAMLNGQDAFLPFCILFPALEAIFF